MTESRSDGPERGSARIPVIVDGEKLRQLRREAGMTQEDAARRSGYSDRLIRKAEASGSIYRETLEILVATYVADANPMTIDGLIIPPERAADPADKNAVIMQDWFDRIFNHRDMSVIDQYIDDNIRLTSEGQERVGKEAVRSRVKTLLAAFDPLQLHIERIADDDPWTICNWRVKKRHTGQFLDLPPTGKWVEVRGVSWVRIVQGKMVECRDYWDLQAMLDELRGKSSRTV